MDETTLTETLDADGRLADARQPGCYALKLDAPADAHALLETWADHYDVAPPASLPVAVEAGHDLLYIGAAGNSIYERLCTHVAGDKRKSAIMRVCPPERVVDVEPCAEPFDREYGYALEQSTDGVAVWVNGELV